MENKTTDMPLNVMIYRVGTMSTSSLKFAVDPLKDVGEISEITDMI